MESLLLIEALTDFQRIGSEINHLEASASTGVGPVLERIVRGVGKVLIEGQAEIYAYETGNTSLGPIAVVPAVQERPVQTGEPAVPDMALQAVERQRRVLSYEEQQDGPMQGCFPLIVSGETLGVLCVFQSNPRPLSEMTLLILENYANLAAMALAAARQSTLAQQEQARKERELRRLRRAAMIISSRSNLNETLEAILEVALDITDAIYGVFRLVDRSGKNLVCMAITGVGLEKPAVEPLPMDGHSIMATVANRREPVVVSDLREAPWREIYYPLDHKMEMRSEVAVPLIGASGRLEGVLNLESPQVAAFDKQDRYILQTLASQAVVAIQEARLLDALQEISLLLPRQPRQVIHQNLVERACDLLNVPHGMIWLLEKDQLVCYASSDSRQIGLRIPAQEGLVGWTVQEARPVTARLALAPSAYPDLPAYDGHAAALAVPLFANPDGKPLGAFSVQATAAEQRDFEQSDWDKKVLDILGHYAALAVQLAEQQEALRIAQDQRALTEAFAAIGDIAANLLHRLNNKIGTIPVRIEGIQDKSARALESDAYLAHHLEAIQHSAAEAMEIVRESLFHLHPVELAPVSVAGSVRQAIASIRLPESVRVEIEGIETLPPVQADSTRLALVFQNLLENASEVMDGKGLLRISGRVENNLVLVQVSDDGPGIAPEEHERIFEFNYTARVRAQPGRLGFGLWWVKSLMARFGGSVSVESDGQHGAAFLLSLPQAGETRPEQDGLEYVHDRR